MVLLFGIAGAGKSVQGKLLADRLGFRWISTGEFLRIEVSPKRHQEMIKGKLLDDKEVITILTKLFKELDPKEEVVLDGFPRTQAQANWLLEQHRKGNIKLTAVINLIASREVVQGRLLTRSRPDDQPEAIKKRFLEFEQTTLPIVEAFKKAYIPVHDINAEETVDEVHESIRAALKA